MKLPPWFVRIRIQPSHFWLPGLWLPVFLLWPLILILVLPVFIIALVGVFFWEAKSVPGVIQTFKGLYRILCETRGTRVDVDAQGAHVLIAIH